MIKRFVILFVGTIVLSLSGIFIVLIANPVSPAHFTTIPVTPKIVRKSLDLLTCSSIPLNPGYQSTYTFFETVQLPCVLFSGSVIGVQRHHGIIPYGEKDIDIACWSDDWDRDHIVLETALNAITLLWKVSLQGYYVPIDGSSYFLDIWLHGPAQNKRGDKTNIDAPTRCLGFTKKTFNTFPMFRILPELAFYLIKKPSKKLRRSKHEWTEMKNNTCFTFYKFFGRQYLSKTFQSKDVTLGKSPVWPSGMFWRMDSPKRYGLFGKSLVPVPQNIEGYIMQRYGDISISCGQAITGNFGKCNNKKWSKYSMVRVEEEGRKEILFRGNDTLHVVYKCLEGGGGERTDGSSRHAYSCKPCKS